MKKLLVMFLFVFILSYLIIPNNVYGVVELDEYGNEIIRDINDEEIRITSFDGEEELNNDEVVIITTEDKGMLNILVSVVVVSGAVGLGYVFYKRKK